MPRYTMILAICCLAAAGCGTFSDAFCGPISVDSLTGKIVEDPFYRGVRYDIAAIKAGGANALLAADVPFSAVADTILLPLGILRWTASTMDSAENAVPANR